MRTSAEPMTTLHLRRGVAGDAESLDWIVRRFTPLLLAQAEYHLGPALRKLYDPADLVQESWLAALPKLGSLSARRGRLTPVVLKYLASIITRRIGSILRDRCLRSRCETRRHSLQDLVAAATDVVSLVHRGERRDRVWRALHALRPARREILILRGIEQRPAKDVATLLDLSVDAVDQRYSRALRELRQVLHDSVIDDLED